MGIEVIDLVDMGKKLKKRKNVFNTPRFHAWMHYYEPGQKDSMHCHNADQTFVVLDGECTMSFPDGGKVTLKPGQGPLIPVDRRNESLEGTVDDVSPVLGVETLGGGGGPLDIGEQHGHGAAFPPHRPVGASGPDFVQHLRGDVAAQVLALVILNGEGVATVPAESGVER